MAASAMAAGSIIGGVGAGLGTTAERMTLESILEGDVKGMKERLRRSEWGLDESLTRLKEEFRTIQGNAPTNPCIGGDMATSNRVLHLQHLLERHLESQQRFLKDSFGNYLEILIAIRYSLRSLYLTKNSKRTIGDLVDILVGDRCLHCCSLVDESGFCRGCMCALCRVVDEDLVIERFRNKTKTGRWFQCPNATCACFVHTDGAIQNHVVRPVSLGSWGSGSAGTEVVWEGGKESSDCVQFACPECQVSSGVWDHIRDVLTQCSGVKKKDLGKLNEEIERIQRMIRGAQSAPYLHLKARLAELRVSNEGVNRVISGLRSFFQVPGKLQRSSESNDGIDFKSKGQHILFHVCV